MEEGYSIQLGQTQNVNSINVDEYFYTNLQSPSVELLPYDQTSVINASQLFDDERQASEVYRVYGTVNFMSIINGLKRNYTTVDDFFTRPRIGDEANNLTKNLPYCFDVYLCRALGNTFTGSTVLVSGNTKINSTTYQLKYEILTNLTSCEIYKSGFGKNIYYDQQYSYDFNVDIDIANQYDSFGKPLTNLYLFFNYRPSVNGLSQSETVQKRTFSGSKVSRPYTTYVAGDVIEGDWVFYLPENFEEIVTQRQEFYVTFYCTGAVSALQFKYNPLIPIKLRDFGDELITANISGTSETDQSIPNYAVKLDNDGNYLWKDLLPNGYIDPLSNRGVNYSFVNERHYVFSNIVLGLNTELNDAATAALFATIEFGPNTKQYNKPTSDLNTLGNKC